ncbi:SLC13 family permease [Pseudonocardia kunmingensis]|uniref:Di/tricarboxylate transporter n=1 Tax=Pseudonocardia kunmingensis TaxID=630975 RepID=A0A543DQD9_9PSEU|nr:SLC13 family permease [Pseudonocardia kunmingensis]TQM11551.1 di/tricarboxylate transporter [Pseudonocardia kunmingensis]
MPIEIVALVGLALVFVITMTVGINMGAVAFVATFAISTLFAGIPIDDAISHGFPSGLFVTLVGVTYLFAIARDNGTIAWLLSSGVRMVGGRLGLVPWVLFAITGLLAMAGAPLVAVIAVVAPVALEFSRRYDLHPLLMGLMVVNGGAAGGLAPTSVLGSICREVAQRNGLDLDAGALFFSAAAFNVALGIAGFFLFGGGRLRRVSAGDQVVAASVGLLDGSSSGPPPGPAAGSHAEGVSGEQNVGDRARLNLIRATTLAGLLVLAGGGLAFDLDVGILAMSVAVVLSIVSPRTGRAAVSQVAWATVLLVCGTLTYIDLLQEVGTIDFLGQGVAAIGVPALGVLVVCVIGAVGSAIASTIGMLGALVPLVVPLLLGSGLNPTAVITALALSALVVDASPLSSTGALVVANAPADKRDVVFRQLLCWGGALIVAAPLSTWLVFVLPS